VRLLVVEVQSETVDDIECNADCRTDRARDRLGLVQAIFNRRRRGEQLDTFADVMQARGEKWPYDLPDWNTKKNRGDRTGRTTRQT
jgi:hypothetical protein